MIQEGDEKKRAFSLHEEGWYQDSLSVCTRLLEKDKDPALEILAATNLFFLKRYDDAELHFRDIMRKMPGSSYVHSYLGKVLEAKGDEQARGEFAAAVRLDPANQDALRNFARHLAESGDFRGAVPVLRKLASLSKKREDASLLVRSLVRAGAPDEAIRTFAAFFPGGSPTPEYIDALLAAGKTDSAAGAALQLLKERPEPEILRRYLLALGTSDPDAAIPEYEKAAADDPGPEILSDYVRLLLGRGDLPMALETCRKLTATDPGTGYRLMECDILDRSGETVEALQWYERLFADELEAKGEPETQALVIDRFRAFLTARYPDQMKDRLISRLSSDVSVAGLTAAAGFYEENGAADEARSYYYRAFRCDFLAGGLEYARFLSRTGDMRECEKTLLYIVANTRRSRDLERVAAMVIDDPQGMSRQKRLVSGLISALERRRDTLRYDGAELLALLYLRSARAALDADDPLLCKEQCLKGIDAIPHGCRSTRLEDFTVLLRVCKDRMLIDTPVYPSPERPGTGPAVPVQEETPREDAGSIAEEFGLDAHEKAAVAFLRAHRQASEMELRTVLATRRVVGIMNRLVRKTQAKGRILIEKRGVGEQGEVYEYVGG